MAELPPTHHESQGGSPTDGTPVPTLCAMTTWQRFGDGTWVNVDHVEVVRVEEQDSGGWQLTATFTSGRTDPLGSHANRELLIDCTDALLRGEVGEHLHALAVTPDESPVPEAADARPVAARSRSWRFWRSGQPSPLHPAEGPADQATLLPAG